MSTSTTATTTPTPPLVSNDGDAAAAFPSSSPSPTATALASLLAELMRCDGGHGGGGGGGGCRLVSVSAPTSGGRALRACVASALALCAPQAAAAGYATVRARRDLTTLECAEAARVLVVAEPLELLSESDEDAAVLRAYAASSRGARRVAVVAHTTGTTLAPGVLTILASAQHSFRLRAEEATTKEATAASPPRGGGGGAFHGHAKLLAEVLKCVEMLAGGGGGSGGGGGVAASAACRRMATPTGVLVTGVSGCGKSRLCAEVERAARGRVGFVRVSAPSLFGAWLGETEARVRDVFAAAREAAPAVVLIEEVDALGRKRGQGGGSGGDAAESGVRALSALLCELDGIGGNGSLLVVGTTSLPWTLDSALLRQGRFEKVAYLPVPAAADRRAVLEGMLGEGARVAADVSVEALAAATEGHTPGGLQLLVRTAGMAALAETRRGEGGGGGGAAGTEEAGGGVPCIRAAHFQEALGQMPQPPSAEVLAKFEGFVTAAR